MFGLNRHFKLAPMRFLKEILILQGIGMMFITPSETAIEQPPAPLRAYVGDTLNFTWTSDVPKILLAIWGVNSGGSPNPQYIYVDASENPKINSALDDDLERRLNYAGNLAQGRAWFVIYNASLSDSKTYIASIREDGSSTKSYIVQVIVDQVPTTTPTTVSSATGTTPQISATSISSQSTVSDSYTQTTTTTTPPTPKPPGLTDGAKAGIGVGVCLVVVLICCCCYFCYKKSSKKSREDNLPCDKKKDTEMNRPPAANA